MVKRKGPKGTTVGLKAAKKAIRTMPDGSRKLTLSNMGIINFPKCLLKLKNVETFDLSRNQIQKLPKNIGRLSSLKQLDLHTNKLQSLPESIGKMTSLVYLNLCNNCLKSAGLPSTLGSLTNLESLNLGMNQLDSLPPTLDDLVNLQVLGLFDNLFIDQPEFVRNNRDLIKINVRRNPFSLGDEEKKEEKSYLAYKDELCGGCLLKVKGWEEDPLEEKQWDFSGYMSPNSVAILHQNVWRIRGNVKCKQVK